MAQKPGKEGMSDSSDAAHCDPDVSDSGEGAVAGSGLKRFIFSEHREQTLRAAKAMCIKFSDKVNVESTQLVFSICIISLRVFEEYRRIHYYWYALWVS